METLVRICGIALTALIALVLIRGVRPEFVFPLRLAAMVILFTEALLLIQPVADFLRDLADGIGLPEHTAVLFRALAAAILTQICAGICRENGEAMLASGVELAGKGTVLILSLPLIRSLLSLAEELLS